MEEHRNCYSSCVTCKYWAKVGPSHGECVVSGEHEFMVSTPLRMFDGSAYVPFRDPNWGTGQPLKFRALMLVSSDFGCIQHEPCDG